jgi:hypothetical protein
MLATSRIAANIRTKLSGAGHQSLYRTYAMKAHTVPKVCQVLILGGSFANSFKLKDPSLFKQQAYVGGQWISAKSGKTFKVHGIYST